MADLNSIIEQEAKANGLDPQTLRTFIRIESSGKPNAQTGSYKGLLQLSDSEFRRYGGTGSIFDPAENIRVGAKKLRAESDRFASKYGRQPSATDLYLTHQQGEGGFQAHSRNPEAPAWRNMASTAEGRQKGEGWARQAIWGNVPADRRAEFGNVDNVTSADFMRLWGDKVSGIGSRATPASMMANSLRQRYGTSTEGGTTKAAPSGSSSPTLAGGESMDRLKSAMSGKAYDPDKITGAESLIKTGQDVASKATGWQQALLGIGTAGVGNYMRHGANEEKKAFDAALTDAAQNAKTPAELAQVLIASPNEKMKAAGLELLGGVLQKGQQAPQSRTIDGPYGQKVTQDYVDGQWVTQGGAQSGTPSFASPAAPQLPAAPVEAVPVPQPPQPAAQPSPAPAPAIQAEQPVPLPTQRPSENDLVNLLRSGPSEGGSNLEAKADMLPMGGGETVAPMTTQPVQTAQVQQQPAPQPQYRVGQAVPKAPDGFVHKLSPDGSGYLYQENGQPVFEPATAASERGKVQASQESDVKARRDAGAGFSAILGELAMAPQQYGKQAFERSIGPWSASTPQTADEKGGFWGTGLSVNSVGQLIARSNPEIERFFQGGAKPTEVRDSVETKLANLASAAKPFVRKPGEGTWTDADQDNLVRIVGNAARASDTSEYNRRLDEAERLLGKAFNVKIPRVEAAPKTKDAPKTAEEEVTPWESYRKQYLGY